MLLVTDIKDMEKLHGFLKRMHKSVVETVAAV
jgi:hypothetical protein